MTTPKVTQNFENRKANNTKNMNNVSLKTKEDILHLRKTCPFNEYPLFTHFYIVKAQGYTIFLIFDPKYRLCVVLTCTQYQCFEKQY